MKRAITILSVAVLLGISGLQPVEARGFHIGLTLPHFYDELAPHGAWIDLAGCGWVWRPHIVTTYTGWRPYCHDGQWLWTHLGWYWHSNYPWGAIAFHHGRWLLTNRYQWVWVPDDEWAPAWVCWRTYDSFCGWAPIPPSLPHGVAAQFGLVSSGISFQLSYGLSSPHFVFVPHSQFAAGPPSQVCLSRRQASQAFQHSAPQQTYQYRHTPTVLPQSPTIVMPTPPPPPALPFSTPGVSQSSTIVRQRTIVELSKPPKVVLPRTPAMPSQTQQVRQPSTSTSARRVMEQNSSYRHSTVTIPQSPTQPTYGGGVSGSRSSR